MIERSGVTTFQGNPLTLIGPALNAGSAAPEFVLTANDLSDLRSDAYRGKLLVLSVVPSLDTPVCATQTRTFNQRATGLGEDVVVLTVSMDCPSPERFCGAEGIRRVVTASDYKHRSFGPAYGADQELGLGAGRIRGRPRGKVTLQRAVPEVTQEITMPRRRSKRRSDPGFRDRGFAGSRGALSRQVACRGRAQSRGVSPRNDAIGCPRWRFGLGSRGPGSRSPGSRFGFGACVALGFRFALVGLRSRGPPLQVLKDFEELREAF